MGQHVEAIGHSLQVLKLEMMVDIIFEYLDIVKGREWDHSNYTTFIHTKGTPLDPKFKSNQTKAKVKSNNKLIDHVIEHKIVMYGAEGVGKSSLIMRFVANQYGLYVDPTF